MNVNTGLTVAATGHTTTGMNPTATSNNTGIYL